MSSNDSTPHPRPRRVEGRVEIDGLDVRWQGWLGEDEPRALLFVVHGLAEHSQRYGELVAHFTRLGFACYGLDLRGHGHSQGRRVHVDSFDDYDRDVERVLLEVIARHPDLPRFLVGHSMGGLIALRRLLARSDDASLPDFVGGVISSPGLAAHPSVKPAWPVRLLARLLDRVAPRVLVPTGVSPRSISRDEAVVEAYEADPLVSKKASVRWYRCFVEAQGDVLERAGELTHPLLLMQAGDDRLVDPQVTERFVRKAPEGLVTYRRWPGLYHEIFHEPEKRDVFLAMREWIEERLSPGVASPPSRSS